MKKNYHIASVLIACLLLLSTNIIAQNIEQKKLDDVLDQNGKIKFGTNGSFDARGYKVEQAKDGTPTFKINKPDQIEALTWSSLGSSFSDEVFGVVCSGNDIYAGGYFSTPQSRIAKYNGSSWSSLTTGLNAPCFAMALSGTDIYAGGSFSMAGGTPAAKIAQWNGSSWSALTSGLDNIVYAIAISGSEVYVGGAFTTAGGISSANRIAKWNGSSWSLLGNGLNEYVYAIAISGTEVYVGGDFTTAGGGSANYIAKWNGSSWSALGDGVNGSVRAIAVSGSNVYVGGQFTTAGGSSANRIAKWDGSSWSALGSGLGGTVRGITVYGSDIYVGGDFTTAGEGSANNIAKWNTGTSSWSAIGNGTSSSVMVMTVQESTGKMIVGGYFSQVDGSLSVSNIAAFTDTDNPLPVELTSFTANIINNKVSLNWNTATEKDNYGFEIESSVGSASASLSTGKQTAVSAWEKIGFVNGHGNSNSTKDYSFVDDKVSTVGKYCYRLKQIDTDGSFEYSDIVEVDFGQPNKFELMQNYPNPFNPSTKISFTVPQDSKVRLTLFNTLGQEIAVLEDGFKEAGFYNYQLSILNYQLSSGVYFYKLEAGSFAQVKKMIIAK